jgi:hypothetical protein
MGKLFIWSCCEPFIGIVCACLPTLAPFFRRWWATLRTKPSHDGSTYPNTSTPDSIPHRHQAQISTENIGTRQSINLSRLSKIKGEWTRLSGDVRLRSDDELELTGENTSSRTQGKDEEDAYPMRDIHVQKDVSRSSTNWDDNENRTFV